MLNPGLRNGIKGILILLISLSGCALSEQPEGVFVNRPVAILVSLDKPAPRLMGVNHLFTIEDHFSKPAGMAIDIAGNLYVADAGKSVIHVFNGDGKLLESMGRFGWRYGEFDSPADVAVDAHYRLYIADSGNNRIQRLSLISRSFAVIAGDKQDEPDTSVSLYKPGSIAADSRGYIYIADTWNHRILKLDPLGRLQMEIGGLGF